MYVRKYSTFINHFCGPLWAEYNIWTLRPQHWWYLSLYSLVGQSNSKPLESENDSLANRTLVFFCWGNVDDSIGTGSYQSEGNGPLCNFLWNPSNLYCFFPLFCVMHDLELHYFSYQLGSFLKRKMVEKKEWEKNSTNTFLKIVEQNLFFIPSSFWGGMYLKYLLSYFNQLSFFFLINYTKAEFICCIH